MNLPPTQLTDFSVAKVDQRPLLVCLNLVGDAPLKGSQQLGHAVIAGLQLQSRSGRGLDGSMRWQRGSDDCETAAATCAGVAS